MEPQAQAPGDSERAKAAAEAVAPDALTAQILEKHASGQPLTPQESGKLGAFRAMLKRGAASIGWKPGAAVPGPGPSAGPSGNAALGALAPTEAPSDRMVAVPVNPRLAATATNVILKKANSVGYNVMQNEAVAAGATGKVLTDLCNSATLSKDDQALVAELMPEILAECKVPPLWFALGVLGSFATLHSLNVWAAIKQLRELRQGAPAEPPIRTATAEQPMPGAGQTK